MLTIYGMPPNRPIPDMDPEDWSEGFEAERAAFYLGKPKYEYHPEGYYDENGVFRWALDLYPYENLRLDQSRERDPLRVRIGRWLRGVQRAEGHRVPPHPDDIQKTTNFTGFVWQEGATTNAWLHAVEETGYMDPDPLADEMEDPELLAQFNFVQNIADERDMELEGRRLHLFFRLPAEEKIKRIERLANELLPLIVEENNQAPLGFVREEHSGIYSDD
ncbi:hypothetical protein Clacol_002286 [Clathrus columnatus]|uniref:Uncharacterized protein n=1 Tax=Clathrus columnatus TaxID=1419009 RepID=A0AAV5A5P8_9AGAM|nr:hypothetical protein Clacol_002286 [Clathrus columnatus]